MTLAVYLKLDEAAQDAPHVGRGDLDDVHGDHGQHKPQSYSVQEPKQYGSRQFKNGAE